MSLWTSIGQSRAWSWVALHRGLTLGLTGFVLLLAAAGALYLVFFRSTATPVNVKEALGLYRSREKTASQRLNPDLPPPGVYVYDTTGEENLNIPGQSRSFPSSTTMIVTDGHCAKVQWEPLTQHIEEITECPTGQHGLEMQSATVVETFAGVTNRSTERCQAGTFLLPPHPTTTTVWHTTCRLEGAHVDVTGRVLGRTSVKVGRHWIPAWHTRLNATFSGNESGTNPADFWYSTTGHTLLREQETVDINQSVGPVGSVHYHESMSTGLRSTKPVMPAGSGNHASGGS
jgi:hypothetical protein